MAKFIGTFEEFETFIGPSTNKIVTRLGKQLKKKQKSCQNHTLGEHTLDASKCGKHKSLDAAHFSHNGKDRKSIIKRILEKNFKNSDNLYEVNLDAFLDFYNEAHSPVENAIVMLCRTHHSAYDKKNKITDEYIIVDNEPVSIEEQLIPKVGEGTLAVKTAMQNHVDYLEGVDCFAAGISSESWNFNIPVKSKSGYLLCYNALDLTVTVLKYNFSENDLVCLQDNLKKDKKSYSILIPYSDIEFKDIKSGYEFEFVEEFVLQCFKTD